MALLAMASARSPGLTTSALALALSWPEQRRALFAELDPDGGTLGCGRAANSDPGLKTLAATGRHYLSPGLIVENTPPLPGGLAVLMSPPSPDRCAAALAALNPVGLGETLRAITNFDVIADCGRIDNSSPALPVLQEADAVLFVVRPNLRDIVGLRSRLETLQLPSTVRAGILVVNGGPHRVEDVAAAFALPLVGTLEWDPRAASAIVEGRLVLGRSKLMQSAERIASDLSRQLTAHVPEGQDWAKQVPEVGIDTAPGQGVTASPGRPQSAMTIPSPAWRKPPDPAGDQPAATWGAAL